MTKMTLAPRDGLMASLHVPPATRKQHVSFLVTADDHEPCPGWGLPHCREYREVLGHETAFPKVTLQPAGESSADYPYSEACFKVELSHPLLKALPVSPQPCHYGTEYTLASSGCSEQPEWAEGGFCCSLKLCILGPGTLRGKG